MITSLNMNKHADIQCHFGSLHFLAARLGSGVPLPVVDMLMLQPLVSAGCTLQLTLSKLPALLVCCKGATATATTHAHAVTMLHLLLHMMVSAASPHPQCFQH